VFDPDSRYAGLATRTYRTPDGREITYVTRRFLPPGDSMTTFVEIMIAGGDRLDLMATRVYGDPLHFHLICDANEAMHPDELVAEPGRRVRVALPKL
jgi:hypothetical protein